MRRVPLASSVALSCFVACAAPARAPAPAPAARDVSAAPSVAVAPPPPAPREDGRLPATARPLRYAVSLDVDPSQPRFRGQARLLVDVPQPTWHVVLHGRDLAIRRVEATTDRGAIGATATARVAHGGHAPEEIVLTFAAPLPAGQATIAIDYDAPFSDELNGLYRVKEGERWYAFTQFESTDARRAFPCFDEPSYKVPFDLAIATPNGSIAVANTPEASRAPRGDRTAFTFATTPPLPSYLVAFAVGDFDVRQGAATPVPIRLVTTKGKSALGDLALEAAQGLVTKLGDYFGVAYPFPKLDLVAVPDFGAGAMENPGLITFREERLLQEPGRATAAARRIQAVTIAHELAHIWFGDLVTAAWWNDIWLNEGFATWMEAKIVDQWRPDMQARLDALVDQQEMMDTDALSTARAVRQPVTTTGEAEEAFDGITYQKGAAVLGMIEHWIGEETFRRGVRDYVRAHAWKNATADDLLSALDRASGRDVSGMAATFLDRSGVPNVAVRATCTASGVTIDLRQSPWRPLGVPEKDGARDGRAPWRIPVCIHDAGAKGGACTDLAAERGSLEQADARCPAWSYPNAGEAGYYRFSLPEKDVRAIARGRADLDVPSRIGFLANVWAQVRAGELSPTVLLDTLPAFDAETERHVVEQEIHVLDDVDDALVDDAARPGFRAYVAARMRPHARRLGWAPKPGEDAGRALLREPVLRSLAVVAEDAATLHEAERYAAAWLADPRRVDPEIAQIALPLASHAAGPARVGELRAALAKATTPQDRVTILTALGSFGDPATLRRALDALLTPEVRRQDARYVLRAATARGATARIVFAWLKGAWDGARAKFGDRAVQRFVEIAGDACTKAERDDAEAFFAPRVKDVEGAARPWAEALEEAGACVELRAHGAAAVTERFTRR